MITVFYINDRILSICWDTGSLGIDVAAKKLCLFGSLGLLQRKKSRNSSAVRDEMTRGAQERWCEHTDDLWPGYHTNTETQIQKYEYTNTRGTQERWCDHIVDLCRERLGWVQCCCCCCHRVDEYHILEMHSIDEPSVAEEYVTDENCAVS